MHSVCSDRDFLILHRDLGQRKLVAVAAAAETCRRRWKLSEVRPLSRRAGARTMRARMPRGPPPFASGAPHSR